MLRTILLKYRAEVILFWAKEVDDEVDPTTV